MLKSIATATAFVLLSAAPAFADTASEARTFTRDGQTFTYTKVASADHVAIDGRNLTSGETFHLIVRGKRVSGVSSGVPVSFFVPAKTAGMDDAAIASR